PPNCPPLKADSIRFRSLAFASTVFGRKAVVDPNADPSLPPVEPGGRGRKRAKTWRDDEGEDERGVKGGFRKKQEEAPEAEKVNKRQPLTDGQKRRVAFIRGEINEGKKVCNAYLVLAPLPASYDTLSMADILTAIIQNTNGSTYEGMTLRADGVRPRSSASTVAAAKLASKPSKADSLAPPNTGPSYTVPPAEARRTLFMGGLDFAESEENVRAATEAILVKERGPSGEKGWVEGVRIVRDASTGLGKGFGYVLMRDAECVDELLALPFGQPLKVSKRKPRLERCKTGVAAARHKAASLARDVKAKATPASGKEHSGITGAPVPRDPRPRAGPRLSTSESAHQAKLAEALAKLPQDERKAIKAVDPDRLMRRAQKKKNKVLSERYERKQANGDKATGVLGRPSRSMERTRKERKRVEAGNKTGKRAKF
ncbi:nucleolar protein 12, partial [Phenoliferia sp. Uapishka_3]